jgi:(S)-3,5-dihydroxyphenylglycine transaminase
MKRDLTGETVVAASSRLDVMNFLNEMANKFPIAVSFASGRPAEQFFEIERWLGHFPAFARHYGAANGMSQERAVNMLSQYGRTNGIIDDLIVRQLANDEGICCQRQQIIVTAGCQEAIELCLRALFVEQGDVLLVKSPAYIGITGVAELHGIETAGFSCENVEDSMLVLRDTVERLERAGKRPKALYLVPEFDNPTGTVLSLEQRQDILAFCASKSITILEDNPYGMFRFEGERLPAMYTLDQHGCVIYLGTYSKTICPALRIGFALLPKQLHGDASASAMLMEKMGQVKSLVTVNTSQIAQAIVGGLLLDQDCSLQRLVAPSIARYRQNRDTMLDCLARTFADCNGTVSWNSPEGGFFLTVSLPFEFLGEHADLCAREYGVLAMPLSFFALDKAQDCRLRLAFSNVTNELIEDGIGRLGRYVKQRMMAMAQAGQEAA